jgi:protein-S-isoprenylcysteine O-methyltransferase Ste14
MAKAEKDIPGVIARPPLIYLGSLAAGLGLEAAWPPSLGAFPDQPVIGLVLAALGFALMGFAIREFKRAGTDYHPHEPTTRIVTTGPFRFTRNPLYVSLTLIYLGIAVGLGSVWVLATLVPTLVTIRFGVVAREERYLERKFGDEYLRYKSAVRRWI